MVFGWVDASFHQIREEVSIGMKGGGKLMDGTKPPASLPCHA